MTSSEVLTTRKRHRLTSTMLARRVRWWAWIYLWVALGFIVLTAMIVGGSTIAYLQNGRGFSSSVDVNDFLICRGFEWMLGMWVFIVGCCIASFLNVVAYRLPAGLPVTGHSFCPHCKVAIEKRDNFPILGWIHLQGRCRSCHIRISSRYPIFEAIGGLLLLSIFVSTILSHGANLPSVHQQVMPYGLPVNLRLMESIVFAFAFLHGWLLLILLTAALTHFAHGRLPIWVWFLGVAVALIAIALAPELVVLPLTRPTETSHTDHSHFDNDGHRLISHQIAATTVALGMVVSVLLGYVTHLLYGKISSNSSMAVPTMLTPVSMWIGSCLMIGTVLGFQAVIGILLMNMLIQLAIRLFAVLTKPETMAIVTGIESVTFHDNAPEASILSDVVERLSSTVPGALNAQSGRTVGTTVLQRTAFSMGPLGTLWISTAIWLSAWRPIQSAIETLWRTLLL